VNRKRTACAILVNNNITPQYFTSTQERWDHVVCMRPDFGHRIQRYCITVVLVS
jgi:hypothetical protein